MFFRMTVCLLLPIVLLLNCATTDPRPESTTELASDSIKQTNAEPVYSTSYAINLAGMALRNHGVRFEGRNILVSYMDGVYTVTFERPAGQTMFGDYLVNIDANTSKILQVVTTK